MASEETSLHNSCIQENIKNVLFLMKHCDGICQQDFLGRTPLHSAIIYNSKATLQIFQYLLQKQISQCDVLKEGVQLIDNFKKLFKIYDHQGDTVLHKAVKYNLVELVAVVLKFYKKFNINIKDSEKLGSGDTILHLAIQGNLLEMTKKIIEIMPSLLYVKNYAGDLPQDESKMSLEMKMFAGIKINNSMI